MIAPSLRYRLKQRVSAAWEMRAEALVALAFLGGWLLVTRGIASYTSAKVWPLSAGLFLLALCGFRPVTELAWKGLYRLIEEGKLNG